MKIPVCVYACTGWLLMPAAAGAITAGQLDDFQDGTTQGWISGFNNPTPPVNVSTGGPGGAGDRYLRARSNGGFGAGSKLVFFNNAQWTGDYIAAGVTFIEADMANFGSVSLSMRVAFRGDGGDFSSVSTASVPADGVWRHYVFPIQESDLTGGFDYAATMSAVFQTRILHKTTPGANGDPVVTQMGVDNIKSGPVVRTITQWRSVRTHGGGVGEQANVIDATATGNGIAPGGTTVETRSGGIQKIKVDFDGSVTLTGTPAAGITVSDGTNSYAPTSVTPVDGDTIAINFDSGELPDEKCYTITIGAGTVTETVTGDNDCKVRSLVGDTVGNGKVNLGDAIYTRNQTTAASPNKAQFDLDLDGDVDIDDAIIVKNRVTHPAKTALCP